MRICQTGVVGEILCACFGCPLHGKSLRAIRRAALAGRTAFRLSYVKYSTGANRTTCTAYRALGKPDSTAARRAFLAGRIIGEWHAESKCLFRREALFRSPASLFCILFSDKPEKSMPPEARSLPRKESVVESLQRKPSVKMFSSKNPSASCFSTDASACAAPWTRSGGCVRA